VYHTQLLKSLIQRLERRAIFSWTVSVQVQTIALTECKSLPKLKF